MYTCPCTCACTCTCIHACDVVVAEGGSLRERVCAEGERSDLHASEQGARCPTATHQGGGGRAAHLSDGWVVATGLEALRRR